MSEIITLGPVGMNPRGEYNSETEYEKLDVVTYQGSSYVAKQSVVGQVPTTEYWQKLVSGGVGVDDIVDNLDSNDGEKPLSAKQGNNLNKSKVEVFDTVAQMKAANLKNGMVAETLGYYEVNDGGGATYKITNIESETEHQEELDNGLYANLVIENNTINIRQLGARSQDKENNKYDIKPYLLKYLELCDTYDTRLKLYIPSGIWYCSPINIKRRDGWFIYGDEGFISGRALGTIITTLTDNQEYLIHFGNTTGFSTNSTLKNIIFSSNDYYYNSSYNTFLTDNNYRKSVSDSLVKFFYCEFVITDKLFFQHIDGTALEITSSWEMYFPILNFRDVNALNSCVMKFGTRDTTIQGSANPSAIYFENVMFEKVLGDLIYSAKQSRLQNCVFNNINFEDWRVDYNGYIVTDFTSENIPTYESSNPIHMSLFRFGGLGTDNSSDGTLIINNIQLNNTASRFTTYNSINYCYDRLFSIEGDYSAISLIINNIDSIGMIKDNCLLYSKDNLDQSSKFIIDNINNRGDSNFYYDIDNFPYIKSSTRLKGHNSTNYFYLPHTCTPAYELVNNRKTGNRFLKSDVNCKNIPQIATKIIDTAASICFVLSSYKLYVRAKIANGETSNLVLSKQGTSTQETFALVGTGNFETYDLTVPDNKFDISDNIFMAITSGSSSPVLVDYIIN